MNNYLTINKTLAQKYFQLGEFERAYDIYDGLLQFGQNLQELHTNLGSVCFFQRKLDEAVEHYKKAIELEPDYAEAHTFLSMVYLVQGDYQKGLPEYEWRIKSNQFYDSLGAFERFKWDGSKLGGGKIIVRAEQGIGDTIQFLRYLPLVKELSQAEVVFHCPPELQTLLEGHKAIDLMITKEEAIEGCRACVYLGSLPKIVQTNLSSIPATVPYIQAKQSLIDEKKHLFQNDTNLKVGFVYTGNKQNHYNRFRSLPINELSKLFAIEDITFYSLQKGDENKQLESLNIKETKIIDLEPYINDFADTAALIEHLDLVISIDTSVAHLAGALNKPTLLLLSFASDWRWLLKRNDSPWYSSMRLLRQSESADWSKVIDATSEILITFRQTHNINTHLTGEADVFNSLS